MKCEVCNGKGYLFLDGKKQECKCYLVKKIVTHFGSLLPFKTPSTELLEKIKTRAVSPTVVDNAIFIVDDLSQEEIKGITLFSLLCPDIAKKYDYRPLYKFMSVYRLVDIFLGCDNEYKTISNLACLNYVILTLGFSEMENKRIPDFMVQLFDYRRFYANPSWVVVRNESSIPSTVRSYMKTNGFVSYNYSKSRKSREKAI